LFFLLVSLEKLKGNRQELSEGGDIQGDECGTRVGGKLLSGDGMREEVNKGS